VSAGQRGRRELLRDIKRELIEATWPTRAGLERAVFNYIEGWYNTRRRHSSLGYKSPQSSKPSTTTSTVKPRDQLKNLSVEPGKSTRPSRAHRGGLGQSTPTKIIWLLSSNGTFVEPEDPSSFLMDKCSRHDIPPAV